MTFQYQVNGYKVIKINLFIISISNLFIISISILLLLFENATSVSYYNFFRILCHFSWGHVNTHHYTQKENIPSMSTLVNQ